VVALAPCTLHSQTLAPCTVNRKPQTLNAKRYTGCERIGSEYKGAKANSDDDKMCVKVQMSKVVPGNADAVLLGVLGSL